MKKTFKKLITTASVVALCVSLLSISAFADNDKKNDNTGTGQTQVHIHHVGDMGSNGDSVTIEFNVKNQNGEDQTVQYTGTVQGSKLTIDMGTTDNHFNLSEENPSLNANYKNNTTGDSGTVTITDKEGNGGGNGGKEQDKGLNNFNAKDVTPNPKVTPTPTPTTEVTPTPTPTTEVTPTPTPTTEVTPTPTPTTEVTPTPTPTTETPNDPPKQPNNPPKKTFTAPKPQPRIGENKATTVEILDEDVPLADVPKTGDLSLLWMALGGMSAGGLVITKKRDEE